MDMIWEWKIFVFNNWNFYWEFENFFLDDVFLCFIGGWSFIFVVLVGGEILLLVLLIKLDDFFFEGDEEEKFLLLFCLRREDLGFDIWLFLDVDKFLLVLWLGLDEGGLFLLFWMKFLSCFFRFWICLWVVGFKVVNLGDLLLFFLVFVEFVMRFFRFFKWLNFLDNVIFFVIGVLVFEFLEVWDKLDFVLIEFFFMFVNVDFLFLFRLGDLFIFVEGLGIFELFDFIFLGIERFFRGLCVILWLLDFGEDLLLFFGLWEEWGVGDDIVLDFLIFFNFGVFLLRLL